MTSLETFLYEVSKFFLTPVLLVLCLMFLYALFAMGALAFDVVLKLWHGHPRRPLAYFLASHPTATRDILELQMLKVIEPLRIISRVAPMLGLVATMIPMGPALVAVSSGNAQGMAQNLVVAFSAVIVALLTASTSYFVLSVRRRWLLAELHDILGPASHAR